MLSNARKIDSQNAPDYRERNAGIAKRYTDSLRGDGRFAAPNFNLPEIETYDAVSDEALDPPPLILPDSFLPSAAPQTMAALQEWEGRVEEIDGDTFVGILVDKTAGSGIEEERAELLLCDVQFADRSLLRVGAIFRWVIGYQTLQSGTRQRVSQIVFRRLPAWRKQDLGFAVESSRALLAALRDRD